jgi:hypothetical protein
VNVIRSCNSGIDRIALDDRWEGEGFPVFPLRQIDRSDQQPDPRGERGTTLTP